MLDLFWSCQDPALAELCPAQPQLVLYYNHEYKRKLELGKALHKIVINDEVDEDELLAEHKEALDLHLKKSMETIPNNIEFKPLQRK